MPRVRLNIAQGFYVDESIPVSSQQCVNLYPHIPETQTITDGALIGTSGIDLAISANDTNRGARTLAGQAYCVNGILLYIITYTEDTFGIRTYFKNYLIGPSIAGTAPVIMSDNGTQLCIVAPDVTTKFNTYIYSVATGLLAISDADFDGPVNFVVYHDGYFVFSKKNSNKFFTSELRDGFIYDALDFASAESDPDNIIAMAVLNGLLYIFGTRTYETWQNTSVGAAFPYTKATSGNQPKGCFAPLSLTLFDNSLVWIGGGANEKPAIWATGGGAPEKISTPAIDYLINSGGSTKLALAYQMNWAEKGHNFIAFTVPDVCTVVYDTYTKRWHQRESLTSSGNIVPWRVGGLMSVYSVIMVGDYIGPNVGILSDQAYYEYGNRISRYCTPPAVDNNGEPFTVDAFELMMETGTNPIFGQGSNPIIRMAVSNNNGRTFSPEISRYMGFTGDYENRISWDNLGRYSRSFQPKFITDEPIKIVIVKGEMVIDS
jgi:hypothetical protein